MTTIQTRLANMTAAELAAHRLQAERAADYRRAFGQFHMVGLLEARIADVCAEQGRRAKSGETLRAEAMAAR